MAELISCEKWTEFLTVLHAELDLNAQTVGVSNLRKAFYDGIIWWSDFVAFFPTGFRYGNEQLLPDGGGWQFSFSEMRVRGEGYITVNGIVHIEIAYNTSDTEILVEPRTLVRDLVYFLLLMHGISESIQFPRRIPCQLKVNLEGLKKDNNNRALINADIRMVEPPHLPIIPDLPLLEPRATASKAPAEHSVELPFEESSMLNELIESVTKLTNDLLACFKGKYPLIGKEGVLRYSRQGIILLVYDALGYISSAPRSEPDKRIQTLIRQLTHSTRECVATT